MNQAELEKMGKRCMFMTLWYTALKQKVYRFPHNSVMFHVKLPQCINSIITAIKFELPSYLICSFHYPIKFYCY